MSKPYPFAAFLAALLLTGVLPTGAAPEGVRADPPPAPPLRVLILGGGPDLAHNQAAIESNVRYVSRLLPPSAARRVLFADGRAQTKNVLCEDSAGKEYYRAAHLPRLDGPSTLPAIRAEFRRLASGPPSPVLIYVTGHGSPGETDAENSFDLWRGGEMTVTRLAAQLKTLPPSVPVTAVMVQCFSGAFGNLLFEGGDPSAPQTPRVFCGFFAAVAARPAAGCTPEINEAEYRDFTGYFFAALSGRSRRGDAVTGADYNGDGKIGMDEAFAYALIHDDSIDTPVCTSDLFLRRFVPTRGAEFAAAPWAALRVWADPPQRAALDALSAGLNLRGEGRVRAAYARFRQVKTDTEDLPSVRLIRFVRLANTVYLAHTLTASEQPADKPVQERYARLKAAEARNCLGPG